LRYVKTQDEMSLARKELEETSYYYFPPNLRKLLFHSRWIMFKALFKMLYGILNNNLALPHEFTPILPGLEVKYALEEAEKLNAKIVFLGHEMNEATWNRLYHENRNTLLRFLINAIKTNINYRLELTEFRNQIQNGHVNYVESTCDEYQMNWYKNFN
jgi:hypothetical protein